MNKSRCITRGIKNCRDSRLFKGCSPLQLLCNLIGNSPAIGNFSYRHRYAQAVNRQQHSEMKMKWNIKLVTENKTDEMTTRHLLPPRMYFHFFSPRTIILKFCQPTLHTLASPTCQHTDQSLPKSAIFPTLS